LVDCESFWLGGIVVLRLMENHVNLQQYNQQAIKHWIGQLKMFYQKHTNKRTSTSSRSYHKTWKECSPQLG